MRITIYLILLAMQSFGATIALNVGKDDNKSFSMLHIEDKEPFLCETMMGDDFKVFVECVFKKTITPEIIESNADFNIQTTNNRLVIKPKKKIALRALQDDYITSNSVKVDIKNPQKHWVVIGFDGDESRFGRTSARGLDFDVTFTTPVMPYVSSIGLDGKPIVAMKDAVDLSKIKSSFEQGNFERVIQLADTLLGEKNGDFDEEAKLYKFRALDRLAWQDEKQNEKVDIDDYLQQLQIWLQENHSSKNLPEVLMYLAKNYYKLGFGEKGDPYVAILKEDFKDDKFTKIALLYKADRDYQNRQKQDSAIEIYKEVFYNTEDLDIASNAAEKLTAHLLEIHAPDLAVDFYKKIVKANPAYLKKNPQKAFNFAKKFAEEKKYDLAIEIVTLLLEMKEDEISDEMRKEIAHWYELSGNKEAAYALYAQYIKDYPEGKYKEFIQIRHDNMLLDKNESNITKKLADIDLILAKYPNDPIATDALIEKARILTEQNDFAALFAMEKPLKAIGGEKLLSAAANKKIAIDLKNDNCKDAVYLAGEYNVSIDPQLDEKFYACLMRFAKYEEALKISEKYLADASLPIRAAWLYRAIMAYSKLDNNKKVILLSEDLEKITGLLKTNDYQDVVYPKAHAYYNLGDYDDMMLREVKKAEELFPKNVENIDLFNKVLRYAKNKKDDLLAANYAQKIMELSKMYKIDSYSPMVEIDYINALKRLGQLDKALQEDLKLLYMKLTDEQRANVLYIAGELSLKADKTNEAREFFIKCGEIVENSSWQNLCAQSLKLLEE